jgi:hypothetical protein
LLGSVEFGEVELPEGLPEGATTIGGTGAEGAEALWGVDPVDVTRSVGAEVVSVWA